MKKKMIKISAVSLITLSMTMGNVTAINSVNNEENNELGKQNNFSQTSDESFSNESENSESNTEDVQKKNKSIIGQTKFVDENGNIKAVDVYDGTTGEVYNPKMRVVNTANMVNFNCSSAETTTKFVDYYTGQEGYISKASAADAAFLGIENGKVKFMIAGVVGLVDPSLVEIVNQGTYYASNYEVNSKGKLYHYISNDVTATGNQGNFNYVGEGPSYLAKGKEYYSYDGHYFYSNYEVMINDYKKNTRTNAVNPNNPYYNYFQYLPMRSKTNYNAAQLSKYLNTKANSSTSKLNDTGDIFIKYQNTYGVNALMAASFAALESGWGKSSIAQNKNNLFGLNAVDSNPSIAADTFESVDSCIKDFTSNWMSKRYLNANYTSLFRGGYFGDKGSGIFGKYSSDPYEGEKCASIAENMDAGIAGQDKNYYTIGIKDASLISNTKIDVKQFSNTNSITFYTTISNPAYAFIIRNKTLNNGYYEIQSDSSLNDNRTEISSSGIYNFDNNYAYIKENSISIINMGNDISSSKKEPPKISDVKVSNVTRAGYTVTCTVTDDVEVAKVEFPTWTLKGDQDDLTWEKGEIKGNQVTYTVRSKDHNNEGGTYRTHIYAYDNEGNVTTYAVTPDTVLPANQPPKISDVKVSNVTRAGYTVTCTVTDDVEVAKVEFPTWTLKGDQDDLTWEKGEIKGNQVTYTVRSKDHNNEGGTYRTHIYAYDNEGNVTTYAVEDVELDINEYIDDYPLIHDVYVKDLNDEGYTITAKVKTNSEISKVEFPTWTIHNDQDDLEWKNGTILGDAISVRINRKDHNYEYGVYKTHIYVYTKDGKSSAIAVNPISLKNTQNYKGWYYNNGQKYFYNNNGEMVGNGPAKKVIDVSLYNGDIDWDTVKKYGDIDGAILRIAAHPNGSYIEDKKFYDNLMACRRLDIPFGVYIYDYAQTPDDAMFEASFVINTLKKYGVTPSEMSFPIYYDLERNSITTELYVQFVSAFTSRISEAGYFANVYSYRALLNTNLNDPYILEKTSWVAAYSNAIGFNNPYYSGEKGWQYTSSGSIPGIDGDVDISVWYND